MKYSMVSAGRKKSDSRDKFSKVAAYLAEQLPPPQQKEKEKEYQKKESRYLRWRRHCRKLSRDWGWDGIYLRLHLLQEHRWCCAKKY